MSPGKSNLTASEGFKWEKGGGGKVQRDCPLAWTNHGDSDESFFWAKSLLDKNWKVTKAALSERQKHQQGCSSRVRFWKCIMKYCWWHDMLSVLPKQDKRSLTLWGLYWKKLRWEDFPIRGGGGRSPWAAHFLLRLWIHVIRLPLTRREQRRFSHALLVRIDFTDINNPTYTTKSTEKNNSSTIRSFFYVILAYQNIDRGWFVCLDVSNTHTCPGKW